MTHGASIHTLVPSLAPKNTNTADSSHANEPSYSDQKSHKIANKVYFTRHELSLILNVYGRQVAQGNWRDYALDMRDCEAVFSAFRRASEAPLYRLIKDPSLARKQGVWRLVSMSGRIIKRGHDLGHILSFFDEKQIALV